MFSLTLSVPFSLFVRLNTHALEGAMGTHGLMGTHCLMGTQGLMGTHGLHLLALMARHALHMPCIHGNGMSCIHANACLAFMPTVNARLKRSRKRGQPKP